MWHIASTDPASESGGGDAPLSIIGELSYPTKIMRGCVVCGAEELRSCVAMQAKAGNITVGIGMAFKEGGDERVPRNCSVHGMDMACVVPHSIRSNILGSGLPG
jgi:hypothetical protein